LSSSLQRRPADQCWQVLTSADSWHSMCPPVDSVAAVAPVPSKLTRPPQI
jgi:hypothetical protein